MSNEPIRSLKEFDAKYLPELARQREFDAPTAPCDYCGKEGATGTEQGGCWWFRCDPPCPEPYAGPTQPNQEGGK